MTPSPETPDGVFRAGSSAPGSALTPEPDGVFRAGSSAPGSALTPEPDGVFRAGSSAPGSALTPEPDVDSLAQSMLLLHGGHDDDDHEHGRDSGPGIGSWSKAPDFAGDPARAAAVHAATERDRQRYLTSGLTPVDCRFCHATVSVKKLGPEYTAVQWNSAASERCAYFSDVRSQGGNTSRTPSCPRLADSIKHAIAEGCLEAVSSAPSPGDG